MSRRTRRARAVERARRAVLDALGPELAGEYDRNWNNIVDELAGLIADGYTTTELGASVLVRMNELADAALRGEISTDEGCALVTVHALAERDGRGPD